MWLFTTFGFFSVTEVKQYGKPRPGEVLQPPGTLQVRARVFEDLELLREKYLPELTETIHLPGRDYPYRGYCTKTELSAAMVQIVHDIVYNNFKGEVMRTQGLPREKMYSRVWGVMYQAEERLAEEERKEEERRQQSLPMFRDHLPEYLEPWIEDVWVQQAQTEAPSRQEVTAEFDPLWDDRSDAELDEAAEVMPQLEPDEIISEDPYEVQEAMLALEARRRN